MTIYEVIDGDPEPLRSQKSATVELMERAFTHYYARRPEEAMGLQARDVRRARRRGAAALASACRALVIDGIPPEWDGIERLSEK